jgi:hypothetical protein
MGGRCIGTQNPSYLAGCRAGNLQRSDSDSVFPHDTEQTRLTVPGGWGRDILGLGDPPGQGFDRCGRDRDVAVDGGKAWRRGHGLYKRARLLWGGLLSSAQLLSFLARLSILSPAISGFVQLFQRHLTTGHITQIRRAVLSYFPAPREIITWPGIIYPRAGHTSKMSRYFPHSAYAEDQPMAHTILGVHVLTRNFTTGAIVGGAVSGVRRLFPALNKSASASAVAATAPSSSSSAAE